jgi:phospholipase C
VGSASVYLQNNTDAAADLTLYHMSANFGSVGLSAKNVPPGGKIGPLQVQWSAATPADFWYASIAVSGGAHPGMYVSSVPDDILLPYWKECMLLTWGGDDGSSPVFTVDEANFSINLKSGGCVAAMQRIGDYSPVTNIFVLMLENHSFDNIFAFSGVQGITAATTANYNQYTYEDGNGSHTVTCNVSDTATPTGMPTDPGHEFADVVQQLSGSIEPYAPPTYPAIDMSGFLANYATSSSEKTGTPAFGQICDIMACFDTPVQLPNINQLAHNYVICDHWFSSMPGPTWPNRFFVHGASSAYLTGANSGTYQGLDDSPTTGQTLAWESVDGFTYRNGSIFDALDAAGIPWRIYHDDTLNLAGSVPQVTALKGISVADPIRVKGIGSLAGDLQSGYPYRYTFIEPNYGDITGNTYKGGSSQHPEDDVAGGENLIGQVFNAISRSPLWHSSVLIITYDEHGGFYDSRRHGAARYVGRPRHQRLRL